MEGRVSAASPTSWLLRLPQGTQETPQDGWRNQSPWNAWRACSGLQPKSPPGSRRSGTPVYKPEWHLHCWEWSSENTLYPALQTSWLLHPAGITNHCNGTDFLPGTWWKLHRVPAAPEGATKKNLRLDWISLPSTDSCSVSRNPQGSCAPQSQVF